MEWNNVVEALMIQGALWIMIVVLVGSGVVIINALEGVHVQIPTTKMHWPKFPAIAWSRILTPVWKTIRWLLAIGGLFVVGVAAPQFLGLRLAQSTGLAYPMAWVVAANLLAALVVVLCGVYLLIKRRDVIREMRLYALLWFAIAVSWLSLVLAGVPLALLSNF